MTPTSPSPPAPRLATPRVLAAHGVADPVPLRPGLHRALPPRRAPRPRDLPDDERRHPHAGRGGPWAGGGARARSWSPGRTCLNLVSGVFGKGFGYWLTATSARSCTRSRSATTTPIDPATWTLSRRPSGDPDGFRSALRDTRRARSTRRRDRPDRHGARRADDRRLRLVLRRHPLEPDEWQLDLCVAGAAEMPRPDLPACR